MLRLRQQFAGKKTYPIILGIIGKTGFTLGAWGGGSVSHLFGSLFGLWGKKCRQTLLFGIAL